MQEITDPLKENVSVLFANESQETLEVFRGVVDHLGWTGRYVHDAEQLMSCVNVYLAEDLPLDAVVADISYLTGPSVTGITAAREIRKAMPNVPIVFISAYVTSIIREEVRRVGAEIMQSPFDPEALFIRLSQLIHWNQLASQKLYDGNDRRRNSVNRSGSFNRATDYILSTPDRIKQTLEELKGEN